MRIKTYSRIGGPEVKQTYCADKPDQLSVLECMPRISGVFMPNVSFHHPVMHIAFFGKTDCFAGQPLEVHPVKFRFCRLIFCVFILATVCFSGGMYFL